MYRAASRLTRSLALSLAARSCHVTWVPPRKISLVFLIDSTSLPSGSSMFLAATCGSWSSTPVLFIIGAVIMKMIRSTSMTSTNGVTLISAFSSSPLPAFIAMAGRPGQRRSAQEVPLDDVEVVLLEGVHLGAQHPDPAREVVVRHHGRDRGDQADRGREQRLGDVRADGGERGGGGPRRAARIGRDVEEREQDAHHGAEQADERRGRSGGGEERNHGLELGGLDQLGAAQRALDVRQVALAVVAQVLVRGQLCQLGVPG